MDVLVKTALLGLLLLSLAALAPCATIMNSVDSAQLVSPGQLASAIAAITPAPSPTAAPVAPSPTLAPSPTAAPTPTNTATPTSTATATSTATPTATSVPAPSPAAAAESFTSTTNATCSASAGTTVFFGVNNTVNATEASTARFLAPAAATIRAMYVKVAANVPASETVTVRVSVNGSTTSNPTCSIAAGAQTCNVTGASKAIAAGDLVAISFNCAGSTTAVTQPIQVGVSFQ